MESAGKSAPEQAQSKMKTKEQMAKTTGVFFTLSRLQDQAKLLWIKLVPTARGYACAPTDESEADQWQ